MHGRAGGTAARPPVLPRRAGRGMGPRPEATGSGPRGPALARDPQREEEQKVAKTTTTRVAGRDEGLQNLDRIREIIFGPVMREYDRKFRRIDATLQRFQKLIQERAAAVEASLAELSKRLQHDIADLETRAAQRVEAIEARQDADAQKFGQRLEGLKADARARLAKEVEAMAQKVAALKDALLKQLEKASDEALEEREILSDEKTDRRVLGEALIALGKRLAHEPSAGGKEKATRKKKRR